MSIAFDNAARIVWAAHNEASTFRKTKTKLNRRDAIYRARDAYKTLIHRGVKVEGFTDTDLVVATYSFKQDGWIVLMRLNGAVVSAKEIA